MKALAIESLEDIVPHVKEHLLPHILEAIEICRNCYLMDITFNDMWTFGTQTWRNIGNRFKTVANEGGDCPFETCGKSNEYKIKLGHYILRHHRVSNKSGLPAGGKAVKIAAHRQMSLFNDEWGVPIDKDNIVIAIDANVKDGLREVFLGEIMPLELNSNKYKWVKKALVYLAEGTEASNTDIVHIMDSPGFEHYPAEEEIVEVAVKLSKSQLHPKGVESEGNR